MGCGGASKQKITAPEIERPLVTESEHAAKGGEEKGSVVPPLPLAVIPRDSHPLPPQQPDLGKSSPSMSDESSVKPLSPQKVVTTENAQSDNRKEAIVPSGVGETGLVQRGEDTSLAHREETMFSAPDKSVPAKHQNSTISRKSDDTPSEAFPIVSPQTHPHIPAGVSVIPAGPDLLQEEVLRSFRAVPVSPPTAKPGKLQLSPTSSAQQDHFAFIDRPTVKPTEVPALPKEETLSEEVLGNVTGTLTSPPIKKPGKLELSTPKEPSFAFVPSEIPQSSDAPSSDFPFSDDFTPQPQSQYLDKTLTPSQDLLLNAVESGRKTENS